MIATATGLADAGLVPWCYSIASFASLRALEFIRNGPVVHDLPIRIVGVGPGVDYAQDGFSHHALDDVAAIRAIGGVAVLAPNSEQRLGELLGWTETFHGPLYLRLPRSPSRVAIEDVTRVPPLNRVRVLSLGEADEVGEELRETLAGHGHPTDHACVTLIVHDSNDAILRFVRGADLVVVVENHYRSGGLGSLVCELLAPLAERPRIVRAGFERPTLGLIGTAGYLRREFANDGAVVSAILRELT
jgi:transketolase